MYRGHHTADKSVQFRKLGFVVIAKLPFTGLGCPGGSISLLAFIAAGSNRLMFDSGGFQAPGENCTVTQVQVVRGVNRINQTIFSINDNGDIIMVRV